MEPDNNPTPRTPANPGEPLSRKPLLERFEERIWGTPEDEQGIMVLVKRWLQILDRAFIGFYKNKCFESASALTYTSILTLVPLLALLLPVLKGFGVHEAAHTALKKLPIIQALKVMKPASPRDLPQVRFVEEIRETTPTQTLSGPDARTSATQGWGVASTTTATQPLAVKRANGASTPTMVMLTGEDIMDQVFRYVENADISNLGVLGMLGLLWAVMVLMSRVEGAMNSAWAVHRSRSFTRKLSDYLNMLVIVLLMLAGLSMTVTAKVSDVTGFLDKYGVQGLGEFVLRSLPYLIVWAAFIFMYFYIPNTRVRLKSAVLSGLIAGTLFQILQVLIIRTQILVGKYGKIYGVFAILLIMLGWAYFSWCIVLWGAEVCSAHQNLRDWRRRRRLWQGTPAERETLTLRMAALLASPMLSQKGGKRMDAGDLADTLMLPLEPVGEIIDLLQGQGLLVQSAEDGSYIFARSPESVTILELLRLVRQGSLEAQPGGGGWLSGISGEIQPVLAAQTLKDLAALPLDDIKTIIL